MGSCKNYKPNAIRFWSPVESKLEEFSGSEFSSQGRDETQEAKA